jgi:D-alanyl-D-alanine carboxypeptidase/D-alanyl-D-alanine-endopeptidase (penicillin-binding protein 4)
MPARRSVLVSLSSAALATLALLVVTSPAQAFVPPGGGPTGAAEQAQLDLHISTALQTRVVNPRLGSDVAIEVHDVGGSGVLFSAHPTAAQMPASNMKLVTALGALTSLGPGTALTTRVVSLSSGAGLSLVGRGDPLLSSSDIDRLAAQTATALAGGTGTLKVYVSDAYFRDGSLAPGWRSTYVPGEVTYVRSLGRHGAVAKDSAAEAGAYFVARLKARGVAATYAGRGGSTGTTLATASHTVAQAVSVMLRVSDNQVAETLFRHVALAAGEPATWSGGSAAALQVLKAHGISTSGLRLYDGSGLSRSDRLTPRALVQILELVRSGDVPALDGVIGWLPVAGRTGTLAAANGRYTTSPSRCAVGLVHAKTGTLTGALALSGVAIGYDGSSRAFSIIVNNPPTSRYSVLTVRRAMDGLAATVTGCW